jgi:hypothetical protein
MELFLMVLFVSLLCLVFSALAFSAAVHEDKAADEVAVADRSAARAPARPRFFAEEPLVALPALAAPGSAVPSETLLRQIEQHIRLEHAAAEAFLQWPTPQSLHGRTTSSLLQ